VVDYVLGWHNSVTTLLWVNNLEGDWKGCLINSRLRYIIFLQMIFQHRYSNFYSVCLGVLIVFPLFSFNISDDDVSYHTGLATDSTPIGFRYMTPASTHISLKGQPTVVSINRYIRA
jgi:hypothetical protein